MADLFPLMDKLTADGRLSHGEYVTLINERTPEAAAYLAEKAVAARKAIYGSTVYIRGLIEVSNICKNDCLYCGIRAGNPHCDRYRLTEEDILSACAEGYELGFRTSTAFSARYAAVSGVLSSMRVTSSPWVSRPFSASLSISL